MFRSKGISPIVGAVALIGFTMVIAAIIGQWAPQLLQNTQSDSSDETQDLLTASNAGLNIERATYSSESGNTTVIFRNSGNVALSNFTLTVSLSDGGSIQRRINQELQQEKIITVDLNTSRSTPELVRVDSNQLSVTDETDIIGSLVSGSIDDASGIQNCVNLEAPANLTATFNGQELDTNNKTIKTEGCSLSQPENLQIASY